MNKNSMKSQILNIMAILALCFIFCITGGLLQIVSAMIVSVLIGCSITKHHYVFFALEAALVLAVVTVFYSFAAGIHGFVSGVSEACMMVLLGSALGISTNVKMSAGGTVLLCSAVYIANILAGFATGGDSVSYGALLEETGSVISEIIKTQYGNSEEMLAMVNEMMSEMMALTFKLMPSVFVISAGFSGIVLTLLYKKILAVLNKDIASVSSMSTMRGNKMAGIFFMVAATIGISMKPEIIADAFLNFVLILGFAFYVFGLSYIDYLMRYKKINKLSRTITVIVVLPLITMLFAVPALVIAGIGLTDSFADLRKKLGQKEGENGAQ